MIITIKRKGGKERLKIRDVHENAHPYFYNLIIQSDKSLELKDRVFYERKIMCCNEKQIKYIGNNAAYQ